MSYEKHTNGVCFQIWQERDEEMCAVAQYGTMAQLSNCVQSPSANLQKSLHTRQTNSAAEILNACVPLSMSSA